jgi:hypothetical protein
MQFDFTSLHKLMGNSISLEKDEVIRRYRSLSTVNYYLLQLLLMLQFSVMGKDENGVFYYG